jgi:hypothetical protein
MTGVPVRDTKFASWIDEDAWMEKMKGARWEKLLNEEEENVSKYTDLPEVKKRIKKFRSEYKSTDKIIPFQHNLITIYWENAFFKRWSFINSDVQHVCRDVLITTDAIYCTVDIKDGAEYFELQKWTSPYNKEPTWKISPVGPAIAFSNNTLYYLGVKNKLIYYELWAHNNLEKKCLYREKSPEVNLNIERLADGKIIFSKENSQEFNYFEIVNSALKPIKKINDWEWPRYKFRITKYHGEKTFWKDKTKLLTIPAGEILVDPIAVHFGTLPCLVRVDEPRGTSYYILSENSLVLLEENTTNLTSKRIQGKSKDGTNVYGIVTYSNKPKYLLAIG